MTTYIRAHVPRSMRDINFSQTREKVESPPYVTLLLYICIVVALSLFVFSGQSLRLDEAQSLWQTSHSIPAIITIIASDVHVPLYHLILHVWETFFGNSVAAGRALSLIFFSLSIPALYMLGSYVYNRSVGLYASLLLTLSPFMNWYGNEIRMYSLFTLLTILNQYFFLRIYRNHEKKYGGYLWAGYIATAILGMYTHYFFNFVFLSQIVFVILHLRLFSRKTLIRFLYSGAIAVVAFAPWIILVTSQNKLQNQTPALTPPTSINLFNTFSQFLFGFQSDHLNTIIISLWPLTMLLVFWALQKHQRVSPETIYLIISVLVPIAGAFLVSVYVRPLFLSRYLILTLPAVYLILGWIFSIYPPRLSQIAKVGLAIIMVAMLALESASAATPVKEDYRAASTYLMEKASASDIILVTAPFTIYPVEYYYRGSASISTIPAWDRLASGPIPPYNEGNLEKQIAELKGRYQRMWVLFSYDQGYEEALKLYLDTHLEKKDERVFSPGLELRSYQLQYDP